MMKIGIEKPYAFSEIGKRANNEDCIFPEKECADEHNKLYIVCDGMGGYDKGEIASSIVCKTLSASLSNCEIIDKAIFKQALDEAYDRLDEECENAGTTLTLLHLSEKGAFLAHMGDSRIYHLRKNGHHTEILYKSDDHSFVNELVKLGIITPEKALTHPKRNIVTRVIQANQATRDEADIYETYDVKENDYFFLCTDGVLESISDEKLCSIINLDICLEKKCQMIEDICNKTSKDNYSAYLIAVNNVETR